MLQWIYDTG